MWICRDLKAQRFIARVRSARLRIRKEEALLGSEAIDKSARLALQRALQRIVRNRYTNYVSEVFTKRELSIDVQGVEDSVRAVLILDDFRALGVILRIRGSPPV